MAFIAQQAHVQTDFQLVLNLIKLICFFHYLWKGKLQKIDILKKLQLVFRILKMTRKVIFVNILINAISVVSRNKIKKTDDVEFLLSAHEKVKESGLYNFQGCRIAINKKLNLPYLRSNLSDYKDQQICEFLEFGFLLGCWEMIVCWMILKRKIFGSLKIIKELKIFLIVCCHI